MEGTPKHLIGSMIMASLVSGYLNIVVGSMGGIPAWMGMMVAFYFAWGNVHCRNIESISQIENRSWFVRIIYLHYALEYLSLWFLIKTSLILFTLWGWGSNTGLSFSGYLKALHGESLLEQWAYYFECFYMIALVLAIFPVIFIEGKKWRMWYLVAIFVNFWILSKVIVAVCRIWIPVDDRLGIVNVSDALLLCVTEYKWQAGLYLFLAGMVTFLIIVASLYVTDHYLIRIYIHRKNLNEGRAFKLWQRVLIRICAFATIILVAASIYDVVKNQRGRMDALLNGDLFQEDTEDTEQEEITYQKVAEFLTGDYSYGPLLYEGTVYFPIDGELSVHEKEEALGYVALKGQNVESSFYKLAGENFFFTGEQDQTFEVSGEIFGLFVSARELELSKDWEADTLFVLWDEEWLNETTFSADKTGYCICDEAFIRTLEEQFGACVYHAEDFADYDAYFTIRAYSDPELAFGADVVCGDYVGCILVKDNAFFYGSYNNPITGTLEEKLLEILGGNKNSTAEDYQGV